jgi:hypothetical protein
MLANAAHADSAAEMRSASVTMLGEMTRLDVNILATLDAPRSDPELSGYAKRATHNDQESSHASAMGAC